MNYYSKCFEFSNLKDSTSETVINCSKQRMARHGIPEQLYTDYGPEFARVSFVKPAKELIVLSYNFLPKISPEQWHGRKKQCKLQKGF